jgi:predicted HTH domain antitoxin
MTDLIIPGHIIAQTQLSHEDFLIELAVYLYDKEVLSMGKAKALARLDLIAFQKELAKREVDIKYDYEDYLTDMKNLENL